MFVRKKTLFVNKKAKFVRPKDPLYEFKKSTRGEMGKYSVEGEVWRAIRKLILLATGLALVYFIYECYMGWNIFQ